MINKTAVVDVVIRFPWGGAGRKKVGETEGVCTGTKKHVIGGGRDGGGKSPRVETGEEEVW